MSNTQSETKTFEYPTTSTFETLFEELVDRSKKIIDIADRRKKYPRDDERYYDAMIDLDVIVTVLPILGRSLKKEMDRLDDMFPDEYYEDDEDDDE